MHIRHWRAGTFIALFVLAVGVVLASVPGWRSVEFAWQAVGCLVLALLILPRLAMAMLHVVRGDWPRLRGDALQALVLASSVALIPCLSRLSDWVELIQARSSLSAQAQAAARSGGVPIAWDGAGWPASGTLYDRTREVDKPWSQRSAAWRSTPFGAKLGECVSVRHLVGPWYRWSDACADR
jgi:hypothetical protein